MNISDKGVATLKNTSRVIQINTTLFNKSKSTSNEESAIFWNHSADKFVEMILLYVVQQLESSFARHKCENYANIKSMCRKWARIIEGKGPPLLPKIYIDTYENLLKNPATEKSL